jgi:predicted ArsR family transcriptional regulator
VTEPALTAEQARALGAPARRAILARLAETDEPVTVAELTEQLAVNHNAVRKHLAVLVGAGLVAEEHEARVVPGRPRLLYRLTPQTARTDPYRDLAVLLATALATGDDPAAIGRNHAAAHEDTPPEDAPIDALRARFAADGFDPSLRRRKGRTEIVLGCCPYVDAAEANPDVVCRLHLGLAQGAAAAIGGLRVDDLTPRDPRRAGCRLAVTEVRA